MAASVPSSSAVSFSSDRTGVLAEHVIPHLAFAIARAWREWLVTVSPRRSYHRGALFPLQPPRSGTQTRRGHHPLPVMPNVVRHPYCFLRASLFCVGKYSKESQKKSCILSAYICVICGPFRIFFIRRFRRWSQMKDYEHFVEVPPSHLPMEITEEPFLLIRWNNIFSRASCRSLRPSRPSRETVSFISRAHRFPRVKAPMAARPCGTPRLPPRPTRTARFAHPRPSARQPPARH